VKTEDLVHMVIMTALMFLAGKVGNTSWSLQKRTGAVKLIHLEIKEQEVKKEKEEKIKVILKKNNIMACEKVKDPKAKKRCLEANKQLADFKAKNSEASMRQNDISMRNRAIETITDKMNRQAGQAMKPKYNK